MDVRKLDQAEIEKKIHEINSGVSLGWEIEDEKLTKTFKFKDFQQAFGFMTMCAIYAEKQNHHPEWFNVYSTVKVQLTTHEVAGISYKDFDLASKMEQVGLGLI